jgi:hypothetical protein
VIYAATREEVATRRIGLRPRIAQVERDAARLRLVRQRGSLGFQHDRIAHARSHRDRVVLLVTKGLVHHRRRAENQADESLLFTMWMSYAKSLFMQFGTVWSSCATGAWRSWWSAF